MRAALNTADAAGGTVAVVRFRAVERGLREGEPAEGATVGEGHSPLPWGWAPRRLISGPEGPVGAG